MCFAAVCLLLLLLLWVCCGVHVCMCMCACVHVGVCACGIPASRASSITAASATADDPPGAAAADAAARIPASVRSRSGAPLSPPSRLLRRVLATSIQQLTSSSRSVAARRHLPGSAGVIPHANRSTLDGHWRSARRRWLGGQFREDHEHAQQHCQRREHQDDDKDIHHVRALATSLAAWALGTQPPRSVASAGHPSSPPHRHCGNVRHHRHRPPSALDRRRIPRLE